MLRGGVPIGRAFGVALRLNYSWFIVFALVTWALAFGYFPTVHPRWSLATSITAGVITSLLFFGSVLAHELSHSVVAQSMGIPVRSITLFIFGGVSEITQEPKSPRDEFRMALAGPMCSLLLGGIFWAISYLRGVPEMIPAIAFWLGWINIFLGVFNLIPGFPLDGGRVLRSLLWWRSGNLRGATRAASGIGRGVGYLFIFGGIWFIFTGNWFNGIWLALIGWFLESAAAGSYRQLLMQEMLQGHTVSEIMTRDCLVVPPDLSVEQLVNEHILKSGRRCFPVVRDGHVEGLVSIHDVRAMPREAWPTKRVNEAMIPFDKVKWVTPDQDLASVMSLLTEDDINQLPVVQDHNIVGMIARDNLLSFIRTRTELGI
ncbi:MAG: site-2 protease family protein [Chloroflexota bacterium]|nr:site-2 protease family protein [Chloroflexota bacterium]